MMNNKLQKGILTILLANIINLVFNLLTNFLLPKYLSVDSYSAIKTFQLYGMYIGVFSLGCADGMYLRYGGKDIKDIEKEEIKNCLFTFRCFLIIETIIFLMISVFIKDKIIMATVLTIISLNMTGYFKNLYQASGEFKQYGNILNLTTAFTFAVNMLLLFVVKTDDFFYYLIGYALVDAIIWILLEFYAVKIWTFDKNVKKIDTSLFVKDVKNGITLMVGNFSSTFLTSMDRWFVKVMMNSIAFAQYSFAVSLEGFLNTAITPITVTLYNYFCNKSDKETVVQTRKLVLIFASFLISLAFPAKFIVDYYLGSYVEATNVLFILFSAQIFYIPIKGIYVNLYKAKGKQNLYFAKLVFILLIGAILNYLLVLLLATKEAFAYGTLIAAIIWLIFSVLDFRSYGFTVKEFIYCAFELCIFLVLGFNVNAIIGFIAYIVASLVMTVIFLHDECIIIYNKFLQVIAKLMNK